MHTSFEWFLTLHEKQTKLHKEVSLYNFAWVSLVTLDLFKREHETMNECKNVQGNPDY